MDVHTGEHPRIGAVDVIPFVPLAATTMDDCVELARAFGRAHRDPLRPAGLPVRQRRDARPERVKLADVRRGQYEGLKGEIDQPRPGAGLRPGADASVGRARSRSAPGRSSSPTTSTSTRRDVELAKRIARRVRESGGGLPKVQANGFWIEELGRAQVSMNLLDFATTPLWLVWETVRDVAAEDGVDLAESELIGLAPAGGLPRRRRPGRAPPEDPVERRLAAAAAFLRLRDFSPMQALELRLEAARARAIGAR